MATGYEPLNALKEVAADLWIVDGPVIRFWLMPFPTRCTVIRLPGGRLWVHSPTRLTEPLAADLEALGQPAYLIAPNWIHYAHLNAWQARWPEAEIWAAPGVVARAARKGMVIAAEGELTDTPEPAWAEAIDQHIVHGSKVHIEAVFLHRASRTLILTDLIENFDPHRQPFWMRPLLRLGRVRAPDGQTPADMLATFRGHEPQLRAAVEMMIGWRPERVVIAHGDWFQTNAEAELRRAFRKVLTP